MIHIFSIVCFLIYGVESRSGHDRSQSFSLISHASGPKLAFEIISKRFCMVLRGGAQKALFFEQTK